MDYFTFITSVVAYVERRVRGEIDYSELERVTGFSFPHIREVFKEHAKMPLAKYILYRKIANAAFEITHSERRILDIANDYGFETYDTFTRAFKRFALVTPKEFRQRHLGVGRIKLAVGIYGPGIIGRDNVCQDYPSFSEVMINMKNIKKSENSCILHGVPKVKYCFEECTPFPSVLKACLNYIGQDINYMYLMAASGAAFRLRWNTKYWDGGNVDIMCIYEDKVDAFQRSFKAAGRGYNILFRNEETTKNDFVGFIKSQIDEGRPVIALGIIGPPEACIITGYRDNGHTILGWNFFQDNPEYSKGIEIDESGYFISKCWWENPETCAVMSIDEEKCTKTSTKDILLNAIDILTKERIGDYAGGQAAFDAWAHSLSDESQFPKDVIMPILFERIMCQGDAMTMIGEGRAYAGFFMEWVGSQYEMIKHKCTEAAYCFKQEFNLVQKMSEHLGSWEFGEEQARNLANPLVRKEIIKLIMEMKKLDGKACEILKEIVEVI